MGVMNLKTHITASVLVLTQTIPALAQEERTPYATTRKCAVDSLRAAYAPAAVRIISDEHGPRAFLISNEEEFNTLISIDPVTALVNWIDVQKYTFDMKNYEWAYSKLDYKNGQQNGMLSDRGSDKTPVIEAADLMLEVDDLMRRCMHEYPLGNLEKSTPHNFNLG